MFQKTTYSGNQCNNYLYFSFDAEYFDTEKITEELNIQPTFVMIKKEPVPKSTAWNYRIDAGNEIDLATYLEKLINIFEPKIGIINKLKEKYGLTTKLQFVIDVNINPESSTPYFGLNKKTIEFLSKTETEVDFDLYKTDTIGIQKNLMNKKHPYENRLRLRLNLPWFLINLGLASKGKDCELVNAKHRWYNVDGENSGCYYCKKITQEVKWK